MSPPRKGQCNLHRTAAATAPYFRIKKDRHRHCKVSGGLIASLSDDALAGIFTRLPDASAVIRCAATCRRWGRVVATRAAVISRSLPPLGRFFPDLAVGLFHQGKDWPTTRGRDAALSPRPRFVATASDARFLGDGRRSLGVAGQDDGVELLDHSRPVASRNGRLVLELRRDRRQDRAADGLRLAICNPMTPDNAIVVLPPLFSSGKNSTKILDYGCALLTGHDLRPPGRHALFRILLVYNRGGGPSTVLRRYSSDTARWGPETESIVKIPGSKIRSIGPAVVRGGGMAFWALEPGLFGVHMDHHQETQNNRMEMHLVPCDSSKYGPGNRLMGVSPDNRLFLVNDGIKFFRKIDLTSQLTVKLTYLEFADEDDIHNAKMSTVRDVVPMQEMGKQMCVIGYPPPISLRWFGEKSGILMFTMGEGSGHNGTYVLNLRDKAVEKVADDGHSRKNLLGYEMDMAAYLASVGQRYLSLE